MTEPNRPELPLNDDNYCFACGKENPIGLHLEFTWDPETGDYCSVYTPAREHQGWERRTHGGFIALVFDEVLSRVVLAKRGLRWVTAELTMRLVRPALVGETLHFRARIESERSRLTVAVAEATLADGVLVATGQAKMMPVRKDLLPHALGEGRGGD